MKNRIFPLQTETIKQRGDSVTDQRISKIFEGAGDFIRRELQCSNQFIYAYAIDGLVSSADAAENIFRPISLSLTGSTM